MKIIDTGWGFIIPARKKKESVLSLEYKEYLTDWIRKLEKKVKYLERGKRNLSSEGWQELNECKSNLRILKTCIKTFSTMEGNSRGK